MGVGHGSSPHLLAESPDGRLRLWAHGEQSGAAPLAASLGLARAPATLWQMRRSLYAALPGAGVPEGVRLRSFLPGLDDDELASRSTRRRSSTHPDQGG